MKMFVPALFLVALFAGCAHHSVNAPSASPRTEPTNTRAGCAHEGGTWNVVTERCEIPY